MGLALEVLSGRATAPGATATAVTAGTGDTFAIRNFPLTSPAYLENVWVQEATAGFAQIRSAKMHDNVRGLRLRAGISTPSALLGDDVRHLVYPQDTLTVEIAGGGVGETDLLALLIHYEDVPGMDARLATWDQVAPRVVNVTSIDAALTTSATAGDWPAGTALSAATTGDLLKANTDYAVYGYVTDVAAGIIALRGPDTGNVRVGGPAPLNPIETRDWFVSLSKALGKPAIPIINSANKGATLMFAAGTAVSATVNTSFIVAELRP